MTQPGSSPSSPVATRIREQVAHAREALSAIAPASAPAAESTDHRDFVRHYLRFLSVQAVGKFEQAIGKLAQGLDILGRRTSATQARLARTEQDVLTLAAGVGRVRELPLEVQALAERLARVEAQLTARGRDGADAEFIDAAARHLRGACLEIGGRECVALGPVSPDWMATLVGLGLATRCALVEALADVAAESADLVTALGVFEHVSPLVARHALEGCRRVLRPGGAIVLMLDATPAHSRPAFLERLDERVNEPSRLASLLHEAGFDRIIDRPLHAAWPAWRVLTARSV
jgi:SAM-dependent methyltransferase